MSDCPNFEKCGFVKQYMDNRTLAVKGFILIYCKGEKQNVCERKKYKEKYGTPPPDSMMPNGAPMK